MSIPMPAIFIGGQSIAYSKGTITATQPVWGATEAEVAVDLILPTGRRMIYRCAARHVTIHSDSDGNLREIYLSNGKGTIGQLQQEDP